MDPQQQPAALAEKFREIESSPNIDQHRPLPPALPTAAVGLGSNSVVASQQQQAETCSNSESIDETKERLQRFDLVIQHLHRLRATLALDSSVRELQKLQTLNILGQSLLPPPPGHHGEQIFIYFLL